MKWINVKDNLPKTIGDVLVFGKYKNKKYIAWAFYNSDGKFCTQDGYDNFVTHWTELPDAPLEEVKK